MLKEIDWQSIAYIEALEKQLELVETVQADPSQECIVYCNHPSVVTLGRASEESDLIHWDGDVVKIQRGGKATYHGPEQLVVYPILNLNHRKKDLHLFLRKMENALVASLKEFGVDNAEGGRADATGVWIANRKIASMGIAVKKWVSYHGLAININKDDRAFKGISPCGFAVGTMVSLEELIGKRTEISEFQKVLSPLLQKEFSDF